MNAAARRRNQLHTRFVNATTPSAVTSDASSVGAAARTGDREALRAIGARGGKARAERERHRRETRQAEVVLATIADRRAALERAAAAVEASNVDETRRATAMVAVIRELNTMDGYDELAREVERLRQALANAAAMGHGQTITLASPWDEPTGGQPVTVSTNSHSYSADVDQSVDHDAAGAR